MVYIFIQQTAIKYIINVSLHAGQIPVILTKHYWCGGMSVEMSTPFSLVQQLLHCLRGLQLQQERSKVIGSFLVTCSNILILIGSLSVTWSKSTCILGIWFVHLSPHLLAHMLKTLYFVNDAISKFSYTRTHSLFKWTFRCHFSQKNDLHMKLIINWTY